MQLGKGHWPDSLDDDGFCTDPDETPWEDWRIVLHGGEAGEYLKDPKEIAKVLKSLGYKLIRVMRE